MVVARLGSNLLGSWLQLLLRLAGGYNRAGQPMRYRIACSLLSSGQGVLRPIPSFCAKRTLFGLPKNFSELVVSSSKSKSIFTTHECGINVASVS